MSKAIDDIALDMDGFDQAMDVQRAQSRSVASYTGISDSYKNLTASGFTPEFVGHDKLTDESALVLLVKDGVEVETAEQGSTIEIVTEKTPFYGEAGGQVGDMGTITAPGVEVAVSDTVKDPTGLIIHKGKIVTGRLAKGDAVTLQV